METARYLPCVYEFKILTDAANRIQHQGERLSLLFRHGAAMRPSILRYSI
jgi:hypothetical protein